MITFHTLTEAAPIRRLIPDEPCFVNMISDLSPDKSSYRVDEVRISKDHVSFKVSRRSFGMTGNKREDDLPWEHVDELIPAQLRPFKSGVWCRGNDEINRMLIEAKWTKETK